MIEIYNASSQLTHIKDILNTTTIKNTLLIPLTEKDEAGVDLGTTNNYGVVEQSPFFLTPNYLPQLIINLGSQEAVDEQFNTAEMNTGVTIYYAFEFEPHSPTHLTAATRLQFVAEKLLEKRTGEDPYWFSMTFPRILVQNPVNKFYEESQIPIHVGAVDFILRWKGAYR